MGTSRVGVLKEVCCTRRISVGRGEEVGREVVSFVFEGGGPLEESQSG